MKISEALPQIFSRSYPVLEPSTKMLLAVALLRFHQIDALPLTFRPGQKKRLAVLGYSCLATLLRTDPKNYGKFLEQPCKNVAQELTSLPLDSELKELLQAFEKSKFGFALIEGRNEAGGLASLRDLLGLYANGVLSCGLTIDKVASPIFTLPGKATLKDTLREMFDRRFRRIFVAGSNVVISDRQIIGYIFSTTKLKEIAGAPKTMLDATLDRFERFEAKKVSASMSIKVAASLMKDQIEECLICEKGVVTPWDLIMKPFEADQVNIKK